MVRAHPLKDEGGAPSSSLGRRRYGGTRAEIRDLADMGRTLLRPYRLDSQAGL
jgi:hypothetical protein